MIYNFSMRTAAATLAMAGATLGCTVGTMHSGSGASVTPAISYPMPPYASATATIHDLTGGTIGTVTLSDTRAGVLIVGTVSGLGLGAHGIHVHAVGKCEAPFTSAGGHFNPGMKHHGFKAEDGPHLGDLPNINTPAAGALHFEMLLANVTLKGQNALLDADGAAIVIHAGQDDYMTDPAGNSGARIACGVITAK